MALKWFCQSYQLRINGGIPSSCNGWTNEATTLPSPVLIDTVPSLLVVANPSSEGTAHIDRMDPWWSSIVLPIWLPVCESQKRILKFAGFPLTASPVDVVTIIPELRPRTLTPFSWGFSSNRHNPPSSKSHILAVPSQLPTQIKQKWGTRRKISYQ